MAEEPVLALVIDEEGRYVAADEQLLTRLGYTLDELRSLHVGALSTAEPAAAEDVWRRYVAGEIDIPRHRAGALRARDGRTFEVIYLGVDRRGPAEWELRLQFVGERPATGPRTLQYILADWRAVERRLADMADDDPTRPYLETLVGQLRAQYRRESTKRDYDELEADE